MNKSVVLASYCGSLLLGCYGAAPGRPPKVPLPELADAPDAQLVVHSETTTRIENVQKRATTCPQGHAEGDPLCTVTKYTVAEPVTRTTTTAALGSEPITFAQFKVLTDPEWNKKLLALDEHSAKCQRANLPRYVGMGLMLGGLITGLVVKGDAGRGIIWGGLGAGTASYTLGYVAFGGRDCVIAQRLHDSMDLRHAMGWTSVEGEEYATEMAALADQFNAAHGSHATLEREPEPEPIKAVVVPRAQRARPAVKPTQARAMRMR